MARRSKSRKVSQRQYRSRVAKYNKYLAKTLDESPKSFKEWNAPYRQSKFLRKEYNLYKKQFQKRKASSTFGFRSDNGEATEYSYRDFKEVYLITRNTLKEEVEEGERSRIGSVITEMVNDQAYELSAKKAKAISKYLLLNERHLLEQKGILKVNIDENGNEVDVVKRKKLELLIRQGRFIDEEVGFWDEIKLYYKQLKNAGYSLEDIQHQIGKNYFESK